MSSRGWMAMGWLAVVGCVSALAWSALGIGWVVGWILSHVRFV